MAFEWSDIAPIASSITALFVGAGLNRYLERKPKLVVYFAHAAVLRAIRGDEQFKIHTHSIVIRNTGKKPATNVRVGHTIVATDFNVFPNVTYKINELPDGGNELVFPSLVPREQLTISYLYPPELIFNQIHTGIRHDDGFAIEVRVLPTQQYPAWVLNVLRVIVLLGLITAAYLLYVVGRAIVRLL